MKYLTLSLKLGKILQNLSSAAVAIGALGVKEIETNLSSPRFHNKISPGFKIKISTDDLTISSS